jgi:hypothetical protein
MIKFAWILAIAAGAAFSQENDGIKERYFHSAGIAVRLVGPDSVLLTIGATSENLQNTVRVFPYGDDDTTFRLLERRLEAYFQDRIPVRVNGKRIYFKVTQWKPDGKGPKDGLDMASLYVQNLFITMGAKLPKKRTYLDITANLWIEREDAAQTVIQFSLFKEREVLRRLWTHREKTVRFPLSRDSIAAMRANPPPPLPRAAPEEIGDPGDQGDHSGHDH